MNGVRTGVEPTLTHDGARTQDFTWRKGQRSLALKEQVLLSIIVPTRNEAGNIAALLKRINAATQGIGLEVIFVDDSTDDTPQVIEAVSHDFPFDVALLVRPPERRNGLGKAVVEGIRIARGEWVCVMDGDLQHPPEVIPQMLAQAYAADANLVAASRLATGGGTAGLSVRRKIISYTLAFASRLCFPRRLRQVTDPMTGFFLVKRALLKPDDLHPEGFKILLEILLRTDNLDVTETPFEFGVRHDGESKANSHEVLLLMRQMLKLMWLQQQNLARFAAVGVSGLGVNTMLLAFFTEVFGLHYLLSAVLATQGSTLWNFGWSEGWVFHGRQHARSRKSRVMTFLAMNNAMLIVRGPMLAIMVSMLGMNYVLANLLSLVLMTVVRFVISDRLIWHPEEKEMQKAYYYNIHNIVRIRSMQRLPELAYFRTETAPEALDLDICIDRNVNRYRQPGSIFYEEFLGRFGFSIVINRGEQQTQIIASPLISRSPHVLYTNVVEPTLRWLFVRKEYALMHGASIAYDDKALFITAQTDTGKTTTILHTIRSTAGESRFLSDDMSIISADGRVRNYPKPLTISKHTLQAIGGAPLTRVQQIFLQVQSRLHSRSGRRVAMWLSSSHIPAATLNAIVQMIIPPPKFMVDNLIPGAQYTDAAQLEHIVLIERGDDFTQPLDKNRKIQMLIANAEDAYGFPPYPAIADELSHWNGEDLHVAEQEIVTAATQDLPATHLGSSCFDWYKRLPSLIGGSTAANGQSLADRAPANEPAIRPEDPVEPRWQVLPDATPGDD